MLNNVNRVIQTLEEFHVSFFFIFISSHSILPSHKLPMNVESNFKTIFIKVSRDISYLCDLECRAFNKGVVALIKWHYFHLLISLLNLHCSSASSPQPPVHQLMKCLPVDLKFSFDCIPRYK